RRSATMAPAAPEARPVSRAIPPRCRATPVGPGLWWSRRPAPGDRFCPGCSADPTAYLLSCPAVARGQVGQRRRGVVIMVIQGRPAGAGDVEEWQFPGQEAAYGRLVRGVEDGPAGAAASGDLISQL